MRYFYIALLSFFLFLAACGQNDDTEAETNSSKDNHDSDVEEQDESDSDMDENMTGNEEADNDTVENTDSNGNADNNNAETDDPQNEETAYQEETVEGDFMIYGERIQLNEEGVDVFTIHFTRTEETRPLEERLMESLVESDRTSNNVLSALQEVTIENGNEATLDFSADEQMTSQASTEQAHFTEMLMTISSLYGIENLRFSVEGESGIMFGQAGEMEEMEVEIDENRGYYVFPNPEGEDTYIRGVTAGEEIHNENGELFDFAETIDAMQSVAEENVAREPGISETIEILDVAEEGNEAEVHYSITDGSEEDQIHFENVLQLSAMDFDFETLKLVNETEETSTIFPIQQTE